MLLINSQALFYNRAQSRSVMNTKTTVIAVAALAAVLGLLVAPLSLNVASARQVTTSECDTGDPDCPGKSDNPGKGHELITQTCNDNNPDVCPPGQNK
jgi:hypothetical protein